MIDKVLVLKYWKTKGIFALEIISGIYKKGVKATMAMKDDVQCMECIDMLFGNAGPERQWFTVRTLIALFGHV